MHDIKPGVRQVWNFRYYRTAEERASKWMDLDEYKKQCETYRAQFI